MFCVLVYCPPNEDVFYLDGKPVPNGDALWCLLMEAIQHRRIFSSFQGSTNWYFGVSMSLLCIFYGSDCTVCV